MRRNNLCIHSTSSVGQKLPEDWEAKVQKFRLYVKENLCGVDPAHSGNMDEVPISFDLPGSRAVRLKGAKEVSIAMTGHEKLNFTVVLSVISDGGKLPPLVVFKRKTLHKGNFPKGILIAANEKGWINQDIMKVWVEKVWRKRKQSLLIHSFSFIYLVFQRSTKVDIELVIVQSTNRYIKTVMCGCNT
jgi:hypothetical protein